MLTAHADSKKLATFYFVVITFARNIANNTCYYQCLHWCGFGLMCISMKTSHSNNENMIWGCTELPRLSGTSRISQ